MVARESDHSLHKVLVILKRVFEDDDVAALQRAVGQNLFVPGAASTEDKFIDQQVIADQQGSFHGGRRNFERLDNKSGAEKREDYGDKQGLDILGQRRFIAARLRLLLLYLNDTFLRCGLFGHLASYSLPFVPIVPRRHGRRVVPPLSLCRLLPLPCASR